MDPYLELIELGIRPDCAADTVDFYKNRDDMNGLEQYINHLKCRVEVSDR